jgi:hypothetical protein
MLTAKKFKARSGGHVSIYVPWRPTPIEIMEGETVEHDDRATIRALQGSPEVVEVETKRESRDRKK